MSALTEEAAKDKLAEAEDVKGKQKEVMRLLRALKSTPSGSEDTPAIKRSVKTEAGKETGVQAANATNAGITKVPVEIGAKKSANWALRKNKAAATTVPRGSARCQKRATIMVAFTMACWTC